MPKRSKIVSGKVIAAVEQSRSAPAATPAAGSTVAVENETEAPVVPVGDVKARFQSRKAELETNRHANDPVNIRRAEKRRAAEEKKKNKHQQKRLVDKAGKDSADKNSSADGSDSKRMKSGKDVIEEGNFVFNRLADAEEQVIVGGGKKNISDPKQALQKLQAQKDKLEKLRATDSEKAVALEEKLQLKKALQKAEGVSIKDDVNLLKKSIQRREKEKAKSRETWNKKKTEQKEAEDKRQNKRNENIQARIDAKKNKKMGIKVKKPQKAGKQQQQQQQKGKFNKKK